MEFGHINPEDVYGMGESELAILEEAIFGEVYEPLTKYCPERPWPKQRAFLELPHKEAFYGGAAGPGKSSALLMGALQYVHVPGYAALILRRDFARLSLPGSIMDRSHQWLTNTDARWSGQAKTWTFPSGATIQFGYIDNPADRFRYASAEFQYIAYDELTEFNLPDDESNPFLFMFSRLRKKAGVNVPLRVRAAANPGNVGHVWTKRRYITAEAIAWMLSGAEGIRVFEMPDVADGRAFIPGLLRDNPAVNPDEYIPNLMHLPRVTRERLLKGDWSIREDALMSSAGMPRYRMRGSTIQIVGDDGSSLAEWDESESYRFATCDPAGTAQDKARATRGKDHSHSVIGVFDRAPLHIGRWLVPRFIWRKQVSFNGLVEGHRQIYEEWEPHRLRVENEKLGVALVDTLDSEMPIDLVPTGGKDKVTRAGPLMQMMERGEFALPESAPWLDSYETELFTWTGHPDEPADQVDTSAYAAIESQGKGAGLWPAECFSTDIWCDPASVNVGNCVAAFVPLESSDVGKGMHAAIVAVGTRDDGLIYVDCVAADETPTALLSRFREAEAYGVPAIAVAVPSQWVEAAHIAIPGVYHGLTNRPELLAVNIESSVFANPEALTPAITGQRLRFARNAGCRVLVNRLKSYPHTKDLACMQALGYAIESLASL